MEELMYVSNALTGPPGSLTVARPKCAGWNLQDLQTDQSKLLQVQMWTWNLEEQHLEVNWRQLEGPKVMQADIVLD